MINTQKTILNAVNKLPDTKIRILTWPTHEGYSTSLGYIPNVEFHMIHQPNGKKWDFHTRKLPSNHYLYLIDPKQFRGECNFDFILAQEKTYQLPQALQLQQQLGIPVISLNHTEPYPNLSEKRLAKLKELRGDINIYITDHNRQSWNDSDGIVINHGIDPNIFCGYTGENDDAVTMVNHFKIRDVFCGWTVWDSIRKNVPCTLIGENPGLSESINSVTELVSRLSKSRLYLNTSTLSPCPLSLLESAMIGLPIVSTAYQEVPKIFQHGVNAFLSNNTDELIGYCKQLLSDRELAKTMGQNARNLMIEKFSIEKFIFNWNSIFKRNII